MPTTAKQLTNGRSKGSTPILARLNAAEQLALFVKVHAQPQKHALAPPCSDAQQAACVLACWHVQNTAFPCPSYIVSTVSHSCVVHVFHLGTWERTLNGVGTILHMCTIRASQNTIDARTPPKAHAYQRTNTLSPNCQVTAVSWEARDDWKQTLVGGFVHTLYIRSHHDSFCRQLAPTQTHKHTPRLPRAPYGPQSPEKPGTYDVQNI
jgi:hypothetical protein